MKILHLIPSLNKGGAERICLDICIELQNQGHEVLLVTLREDNKYAFLTTQLNQKVVSTQINLSLLRKNKVDVQQLQAIIDEQQPAVIHVHLFEACINLAFCKLPSSIRIVVHFHDNMVQLKKWEWSKCFKKSTLTNFYERWLVLKSWGKNTQLIAISNDTLSFVQQHLKYFTALKLLNAINLKRFQPDFQVNKENSIVMIGSFVAKKGQELAIRTISELKQRNCNVHLYLLGDGEMKTQLVSLAQQLNVEDLIHFEGLVDQPEKYLQKSKIYFHTASYEPFGLVLLEAMACGLPVICTDGKGNRDLIKDGVNGFILFERDAKLLADKIQFLLDNDEKRIEMGNNAHHFAQQFGMEEYVKKILKVYL